MRVDFRGIVIIVGSYGSGKTEVALNLALAAKADGVDVRIADLDLVNPYFRTREVIDIFSAQGIGVVAPLEKYLTADLPILNPLISGLLRDPGELTILDIGGDDVGARVIASLKNHIDARKVQTIQVVNPFRPFTNTIKGCLLMKSKLEAVTQMPITGLIGNAHLMDETTVEDIYAGQKFIQDLATETKLPVAFVTVPERLEKQVAGGADCGQSVLIIRRQLTVPWGAG